MQFRHFPNISLFPKILSLFFSCVGTEPPIGENAVGLSFHKSYIVKCLSIQYIKFNVYLCSKYNCVICSIYVLSISNTVSIGEVIP